MGYNYNKGKFYDASGTRAFCDAMQQAVADYEQYAIDTKTAYTDFDANQKFNGIAAFAMKNLVLFGAGSLLKEVTDLHKQMINDQNYLMANFEEKFVEEGQKILRKYGIDPIVGIENLTWAPNIAGRHTTEALERIVNGLKAIDDMGGSYEQIVEFLKDMAELAKGF